MMVSMGYNGFPRYPELGKQVVDEKT